jgi:hypothetical protein
MDTFKMENDEIYPIINENVHYKVYSINQENRFMYLFVNQENKKDDFAFYYSFDDLAIKLDFLDNVGFKALLASVTLLPNGNYVIGNVGDYISAVEELKRKNKEDKAIYRGHYSYKYTLVPSLYRKKKYYDNESYMYMGFKIQFYNELSSKKYIEILTTM